MDAVNQVITGTNVYTKDKRNTTEKSATELKDKCNLFFDLNYDDHNFVPKSFNRDLTNDGKFEYKNQSISLKNYDINVSKVKNNLKNNTDFWINTLKANKTVINILKEGYKLPLFSIPDQAKFKNNKSAYENTEFVTEAIRDLLNTERIIEVKEPPYIVNPLSVSVQNSGKKRLILDLRFVNQHIFKESIKFDDFKIMEQFLNPNEFMFKFDIKQGYHHIDIFEPHQKFLGFSWVIDGKIRYFVFTVLPFGLTSAPFIFTKIMRCLIKYWRTNGIKIACFLDDGLGVSDSYEKTLKNSKFVKNSLKKAGFIVNKEKSVWNPSQKLIWLGIEINLKDCFYCIPQERLLAIQNNIALVINKLPYTTARDLAKTCGKLISTKFVLGDIVQLKTRSLYKVIESQLLWDSRVNLKNNDLAIKELFFWKNNLKNFNKRPLRVYDIPNTVIFSDASSVAIGAIFENKSRTYTCHKNLTEEESLESSTWRELLAIDYALKSFSPLIKNSSVHMKTDNFATSLISKKGSTKLNLQKFAESIYNTCTKNSIKFQISWIARDKNIKADTISKLIDYDDWQTTPEFFRLLNDIWGTFTIDRFADNENRKTKRFNSKYWCPGTSNVDAFTTSWSGEYNYIVPPVYLIPKVITHMKASYCKGVLVVPFWPSAAFWPLLVASNSKFLPFVIDYRIFKDPSQCLKLGNNKKSIIGSTKFKGSLLAIKFSCE